MTTLGVGTYTASIYARGGQTPLFPLTDHTAVEWGRIKNASSQAIITIPAEPGCNDKVGEVRPWGHELVLFRDGDRVWEGPVVVPLLRRGVAVITARDVSHYLTRRLRRLQSAKSLRKKVIAFAEDDVEDAFARDDPNVLTWLDVRTPSKGRSMTRKRKGMDVQYVSELLDSMTDRGLCRTTVGRSIVLWPSTTDLGRVQTLLPHKHISEDVEVYEDGGGR